VEKVLRGVKRPDSLEVVKESLIRDPRTITDGVARASEDLNANRRRAIEIGHDCRFVKLMAHARLSFKPPNSFTGSST